MGTSALEIGADIGKKLIFDIVDEDEKNFVLGLEMSENGAFGHARLLRQEDGGRIAEAPFGEQPGRRAQYGVSLHEISTSDLCLIFYKYLPAEPPSSKGGFPILPPGLLPRGDAKTRQALLRTISRRLRRRIRPTDARQIHRRNTTETACRFWGVARRFFFSLK